jgi:hypothetical protein
MCFGVADRPDLLARCEAGGLSVNRVPKGDVELAFVQDYDGNLVEIKELA